MKTLGADQKVNESSFSLKTQVSIGVSSYIRSKALDEIIQSYAKRSEELSRDLTKEMATRLAISHPEEARSIEQMFQDNVRPELIKERISKALLKLDVVVSSLDDVDLSRSEKHALVSTGVLAGGIYHLIKDDRSFLRLVEQVSAIRQTYKEIKGKYKEFKVLTVSLNEHAQNSLQNLEDFQQGMRGAAQGLSALYRDTFSSAADADGFQTRRIVNFIDGKIRGNSSSRDGFSNERIEEINRNLENGINALGNMASSLDAIILTTTKMTDLLGIELSDNVQKNLRTAQNVAGIVSMGGKAFELYQTGGLSAAMSILGGGSPLGDSTSAQLGEISRKLDQVLDNQRIMINAQIETMNMLKNLAVMIDQYHEREMGLLYELRDLSIVSLEIQKANLINKEIRSCEQLINFQLSSVWPGSDFTKFPYHNVGSLELLRSNFNERVNGMRGIRALVNSSGDLEYGNCQRAFTKAFSGVVNLENPLMSIYDSGEENLRAFSRRIYGPALTAIRHFSSNNNLDNSALHHPMIRLSDLQLKSSLLPVGGSVTGSNFTEEIYALDNLISVKNTQRYLTSLLLLYPLFEVNKSDWEKGLVELVDSYLNSVDSDFTHMLRSTYYLRGALKIVQSAIAQQALMAGEPIIPELYSQFHAKLISDKSCRDHTDYREGSLGDDFICAIRANQQLMKNYLSYVLIRNNVTSPLYREAYSSAYELGLSSDLAGFLGANVKIHIKNEGDRKIPVIRLSAMRVLGQEESTVEFELPSLDELVRDKVSYTDNMKQLLRMQDYIIYELEKVHPIERFFDRSLLLKLWASKR